MPGSLGLPSLDYAYPVASFPSYPGPHSHLYQPSNPIFLLCSDSRHCPHPPPWLCLFPLLSNSTCSSSDLSPSPVASVLSLGCPNVTFLDPCLSNTLSAPLAALSQLPLAQGEVLSRCALFPPTPPHLPPMSLPLLQGPWKYEWWAAKTFQKLSPGALPSQWGHLGPPKAALRS